MVRWNAVSRQAKCGTSLKICCARSSSSSACGRCNGANCTASRKICFTSGVMSAWSVRCGPPCTTRCPTAASGWSRCACSASATRCNASCCDSITWFCVTSIAPSDERMVNEPSSRPMPFAPPVSHGVSSLSSGVEPDVLPGIYTPNFSDDEPLFSTRIPKVIASAFPNPVTDFIAVNAFRVGVSNARVDLVLEPVLRVGAGIAKPRHTIDYIDTQRKAVDLVDDRQLERRIDVAAFPIAMHMHVLVIRAVIRELVNERRIRVEVEDDRLLARENGIEVATGQTVRMIGVGHQPEQVYHVDEADLEVGEMFLQDLDGGERFHGGDIAGTGHHHVRFGVLVRRCPVPDADTLGAMRKCSFHVKVLQVRLLVRDNHVDVVTRTQAMIHHAQQAVRIGRQVDAHDFGTLVRDDIEKTRVLVGETVVILTPYQRGNQQVHRWHRCAPVEFALRLFQPLGVLV